LNQEQLRQALSQPPATLGMVAPFQALRPRFSLHLVEQIDSTNRGLWALLQAGAPAGCVLIADTQKAGRGQWGRQWQSPAGGLYLSLGLKPDMATSQSACLTLASTWGVATSLSNLGVSVQIKWPNDLIVGGKKLGGLLIETHGDGNLIRDAVIGLGINGFNPVPPTGISLQHLFQPDLPPPPLNSLEGLAAVALYGLMQGYFYWQTYGDQALLKVYEAKMAHLGQSLMVRDQLAQIVGVTASGKLRLQMQDQGQDNGEPRQNILEIEPGKLSLGYNA
jgi:BirA family biotin operon repressor/biotin-[acetyl-CoA-carboxylase] ligase